MFDDPEPIERPIGEHELPDEDDLDGYTLTCPHCHGEMYADADVCPHCRSFILEEDLDAADAESDQVKGWATMIIILMIVLMIALMIL